MGWEDKREPDRDAPMSNRWWIFLIFLWTVALVLAAPLFLLPTVERRSSVASSPRADSLVTIIEKHPLLDWTERHNQYELEFVTSAGTKQVVKVGSSWQISSKPEGGVLISVPVN